jgi:hypothetical protein
MIFLLGQEGRISKVSRLIPLDANPFYALKNLQRVGQHHPAQLSCSHALARVILLSQGYFIPESLCARRA